MRLLRRTEADPDLALMADGFSAVDQHWRTLATRWKDPLPCPLLCRQSIQKLSECGSRVCKYLGISPRGGRGRTRAAVGRLAGHLRGLQDEIVNVSQQVAQHSSPVARMAAIADAGETC